MIEKKETALTVSRTYTPHIVTYDFDSVNKNEQNNYVVAGAGVVVAPGAKPYLTNTDKSYSTPDKNDLYFQQKSFDLYVKTKDLYNKDKKVLQSLHLSGLQKLKYINDDNIVLYTPMNPAGNSNAGWDLAHNISNTDKARLASKQSAYEKALANVDVWEYFATFTLDRKKQDRYNFNKAIAHVTRFLQRRHVLYFLVPERHKDGAWHFHALLSREIGPFLFEFEGKARRTKYVAQCIREGREVKNCLAYQYAFGFNTVEPCRDKEACVHYMTKYVLKTFDDPNFERVSRRRFFTSKGLKSPRVVLPSSVDLENFELAALSKYTEKVYLKRSKVLTTEVLCSGPPAFVGASPPTLKQKSETKRV